MVFNPDGQHVGTVTGAERGKLETMLSGREAHPLGKADVGHHPVEFGGRVLLHDHRRRVREDCAAGGVIAMAVAVDHMSDGLAEALGDLGVDPGGRIGVDRVTKHDAVLSHHKD
jgi:hypothetical protein